MDAETRIDWSLLWRCGARIAIAACSLLGWPALAGKPVAYVTNFDSGTVSIIDVGTLAATGSVAVGDGPIGVAFMPNGRFAYVANFRSATVSVIGTHTNTVVATVPINGACNGVAVTPDGSGVYVTNTSPGTVAVINATTNAVDATIPVGAQPTDIAITPDGARVFVVNFGSDSVSVIDTQRNREIGVIPLFLDQLDPVSPSHIAITSLGTAYVTSFFSDAVFAIETATGSISDEFALYNAQPGAVAVAGDGLTAYIAGPASGEVFAINTTTKAFINDPVGEDPEALALTPDGGFLFVTNAGSNDVSVINTDGVYVVATIPVAESPLGVAVAEVPAPCVGDCSGNGIVTVGDLVTGVNIALGNLPLSACVSFDGNGDRRVTVDELLSAVNSALQGCPR